MKTPWKHEVLPCKEAGLRCKVYRVGGECGQETEREFWLYFCFLCSYTQEKYNASVIPTIQPKISSFRVPVLTHRYLLYILAYNPVRLHFLFKLFQLWPLVKLSFVSCAPLILSWAGVFLLFVFVCFSTSLLFGTIICSRLLYPLPQSWNQSYLQRVLILILEGWYDKPRSGWSQLTEKGNMCVCVLPCVCVIIYKRVSM